MKSIIKFIKNINNAILGNLPLFNFIALTIIALCAMKSLMDRNTIIIASYVFGTGLLAIRDHIKHHNIHNLSIKDLKNPKKYKFFLRFFKSKNIVASIGLFFTATVGVLETCKFYDTDDNLNYKIYLYYLLITISIFFSLLILMGFCIESKEKEKNYVNKKK